MFFTPTISLRLSSETKNFLRIFLTMSGSQVSRGTSSDSDDEPDSSSTSNRGYFGCPRRDRSPSPIRVVEDRVIRRPALPVGEPLYPWRRPPVIAASPSFTPVGRDFVPGSVKYPADLLRHLHPEEAARFRYWFRTVS